ncbi:hypothetical protein Hypma_016260 [Hypsizygus marmoreus]|uniref:Geranylgeranyl pyrophosphate synthetase n=1 Tax=Hypsizygus marmoreus TaxID=39966 RepID=A0A369J588_HYPMA|nr:hypothetical protein Hypma_016260 [Hypsizygus marmoreus]
MSGYSYRGRNPRGYSSYTQGYSKTSPTSNLPPDRDILQGLAKSPLQTVARPPTPSTDKEIKITNLHYAGSYNWVEKPSPTIIVPGSPREWLNKSLPYQVHADDGFSFKDQNGYRSPNAVLLPLITAVDEMSKRNGDDFDWASIDFVTDRNNLRKLLRWIAGGTINDFRIDLQLAGKHTVLFNRWEDRYKEQMSGRTFGFNFEKASTRPAPGCVDSTGHHRIVRYDLNGLKMVVRFEVDACIASEAPTSAPKSTPAKPGSSANVDDLIGALSGVTLSTAVPGSSPSTVADGAREIIVIHGGAEVPQSAIVELTTRSERNAASFDFKESYPQLFLSQTPHHFLAVHERGRFTRMTKRQLESPEIKNLAVDIIQPDLKKLRRVLDVIMALAIKHGERGRLSLVCQGGDLKVYERVSDKSCLPDDILQRFDV